VVLHGLDDDVVPVGNSRGLAAGHPEVDLRELADVDHMAVIDPHSKAFPVLLGTLAP
jgi:hypothetical protein